MKWIFDGGGMNKLDRLLTCHLGIIAEFVRPEEEVGERFILIVFDIDALILGYYLGSFEIRKVDGLMHLAKTSMKRLVPLIP